jgi:hypothetical protein
MLVWVVFLYYIFIGLERSRKVRIGLDRLGRCGIGFGYVCDGFGIGLDRFVQVRIGLDKFGYVMVRFGYV